MFWKQRQRQICLWIFPLVSLMLMISILGSNQRLILSEDAVMYTYIKSAVQGKVGYGFNVVNDNGMSFEGLEPGDLLLGGYPGCAYGRFSHVGIYAGQGQVIEAYADLGITVQPVEHYRNYTEICLLKVNADPGVKQKAVDYVRRYERHLFYPTAFKPGERIWNCSKIMWRAYVVQGLNLDPYDDLWIAPDAFYNSPHVRILREKGGAAY